MRVVLYVVLWGACERWKPTSLIRDGIGAGRRPDQGQGYVVRVAGQAGDWELVFSSCGLVLRAGTVERVLGGIYILLPLKYLVY